MAAKGLYQKVKGSGVWYVQKVVPPDVRDRIRDQEGRPRTKFIQSTRTADGRVAQMEAKRLLSQWEGEITEARRLGGGPVADLPAVLVAIDNWRRGRCAVAADFAAVIQGGRETAAKADILDMIAEAQRGPLGPYRIPSGPLAPAHRRPAVTEDAVAWAHAYFASPRGWDKDRSTARPALAAGILIGRLQEAEREVGAWARVPGFDAEFDAALKAGGQSSAIPARVREDARKPFARAWLEVAQAEEAERHRAAVILATVDATTASPATIRVDGRPSTYVPREGDMLIGEVIRVYKESKNDPALEKTTGHVFKALNELLGEDKPFRSITRQDVREVLKFLHTLPANASKIYPRLPLAEAAERAAQDGRKLLAQNTIRSYMIAFNSMCEFAVNEGWADANPCAKQIPGKRDQVKRRAFKPDELRLVFDALVQERKEDSARWWVPSVLAWSGARANEICQLHVSDVKEADGVHYLDLQAFDVDGRRVERRRLKTEPSDRAIPVHSELVTAGFLEFVERRRLEGGDQLFPELKANVLGYYSHDLSKWFGRHCDNVGLPEPSLCLHSLRHGFKDAGDTVRLPEYILEALGGWGSKGSHMKKYGGRCSPERVKENRSHMELIRHGDFTLGPPPVA